MPIATCGWFDVTENVVNLGGICLQVGHCVGSGNQMALKHSIIRRALYNSFLPCVQVMLVLDRIFSIFLRTSEL